MTGRQVAFVGLVLLGWMACHNPGKVEGAAGKCKNTGCWEMATTQWWWSGAGHCWSYNKVHNPGVPMSTDSPVGGARVVTSAWVVPYESTSDCADTCTAGGAREATWGGTFTGLDPEHQAFCQ